MSDIVKNTDLAKMQETSNVMAMLIPTGGFTLTGDSFTDVIYIEAVPITQAQFDKGLQDYAAWKAQQDAAVISARAAAQAKLAALGLTTDDLKALGLGGNE